jgi:hypothetical protein
MGRMQPVALLPIFRFANLLCWHERLGSAMSRMSFKNRYKLISRRGHEKYGI